MKFALIPAIIKDMSNRINLHLVSDATGETLNSIARATVSQFEHASIVYHRWSLIKQARPGGCLPGSGYKPLQACDRSRRPGVARFNGSPRPHRVTDCHAFPISGAIHTPARRRTHKLVETTL